ncbi:MAG: type II and III secretion system protein family protein [Gemmataceae bacterium]
MHPTNRDRRRPIGVLVLLGLLAAGGTAAAQEPVPAPKADPPPPVVASRPRAVLVPIGGSQQLGMASGKAIANVFLSGEGVIRVAPSPDNKFVVIQGLAAGTVRLELTDVDNGKEVYEVTVQLDVAYLKSILRQSIQAANVDVIATPNRTVILTGWVAKPEDVGPIIQITQSILGASAMQVINAMRVGGVQQVQLDVTVASVNRTAARRRGFNFAYSGKNVSFASILGGITSVGGGGALGAPLTITPVAPPTGANIIFGVAPWHFQAALQALRDESLAKVLAEPKVVAMSGRPAHFLSGGQQAVLSANGSIGGPGVDFKDIGTELDVLPIVLGNGRIYLEVHPRFRLVDDGKGITTSFGFVPGFSEQSVQTAVEMEPGQTFVIGGLIQTTVAADTERLPFLGDLPYVGTLFSQIHYTTTDDELVIMVTPHLVDAQDCQQGPKRLPGRETRGPDDYELFLESLLEAPRGQRQVFEDGRYKAAYKSDPSYRQYPCADPLPREKRFGGGNCGTGQCGMAQPAGGAPAGLMAKPDPVPNAIPRIMPPPGGEALPPPASSAAPLNRITPTGRVVLPEMPKPPSADEPPTN